MLDKTLKAVQGVIKYYSDHNIEEHEPEACILRDHKTALVELNTFIESNKVDDEALAVAITKELFIFPTSLFKIKKVRAAIKSIKGK